MCLPRYQGKEGERDGEERSAAIEDGISALSEKFLVHNEVHQSQTELIVTIHQYDNTRNMQLTLKIHACVYGMHVSVFSHDHSLTLGNKSSLLHKRAPIQAEPAAGKAFCKL
ncbi:unnamed protein product [Leuciscus chuanchicus]